jgi:hypothetical protein
MRVRSLVAFVMITALVALNGSDLLARTNGCGPHPCCAKGACKMMPKSGARLDRCGDPDPTDTPQPPMMLSFTSGDALSFSTSVTSLAVVALTSAGAAFGVDRPPRG